MDILFAALKDFITRDFMYVVGGGTIILSFLWAFYPIDPNQIPAAVYIFGTGLAYAIGYVVQDFLSLTPIVATRRIDAPGPVSMRLYQRFTRTDKWIEANSDSLSSAHETLIENACPRAWAEYQRTISLMHVGTALGSSGFVSSLILVIHAVVTWNWLDIALAASVALLTIAALVVGWIKTLQRSQFLAAKSVGSKPPTC